MSLKNLLDKKDPFELNETSIDLACFCYLSNKNVKKILDYYEYCSSSNGLNEDKLLHYLHLDKMELISEIVTVLHIYNKPEDESITSSKIVLSKDDYFQFIVIFGILPLNLTIIFVLSIVGAQSFTHISEPTFAKILSLINCEADKGGSALQTISLKYKMLAKQDIYYLEFNDFYNIIFENKWFSELYKITNSIRIIALSQQIYESIHYRMTNITNILQYKMEHNGKSPPLSCNDHLLILLGVMDNPYKYNYCDSSVDKNRITEIAKQMKRKLMTQQRSFIQVVWTPHLMKLKKQGSSHTMVSMPGINKSLRVSNLSVSEDDCYSSKNINSYGPFACKNKVCPIIDPNRNSCSRFPNKRSCPVESSRRINCISEESPPLPNQST